MSSSDEFSVDFDDTGSMQGSVYAADEFRKVSNNTPLASTISSPTSSVADSLHNVTSLKFPLPNNIAAEERALIKKGFDIGFVRMSNTEPVTNRASSVSTSDSPRAKTNTATSFVPYPQKSEPPIADPQFRRVRSAPSLSHALTSSAGGRNGQTSEKNVYKHFGQFPMRHDPVWSLKPGSRFELSAARRNLLHVPQRPKQVSYNEEAGDEFGAKLVKTVNDGSTCLLISVGHQLGLFSAMEKLSARPRSAESIAAAANNLSVRYVQELLSALTCVGIVEETLHGPNDDLTARVHQKRSLFNQDYDTGAMRERPWIPLHQSEARSEPLAPAFGSWMPVTGSTSPAQALPDEKLKRKYILPPEHALFLTWGGGADNLALLTQYVSVLGRLEDEVIGCFRSGKGLDWTRYGQFDLVAELDTTQTIGSIPRLECELLSFIPGLADSLRVGTSVLCIGSGLGSIFSGLASFYPRSWFTVYETTDSKTKRAQTEFDAVPNLHFRSLTPRGRATAPQERCAYTAVLILDNGAVRDAQCPTALLRRVRGALAPGGALLALEVSARAVAGPPAALVRGLSAMHAVPLGVAAGGPALGRAWGADNARAALAGVGFSDVRVFERDGDEFNAVVVASAGAAGAEGTDGGRGGGAGAPTPA